MEEIKLKTKVSSTNAVGHNHPVEPKSEIKSKDTKYPPMETKSIADYKVERPTEGLEDIKTYQNLTFNVLDKEMKERCNAGYSRLYINYSLSEGMTKYLRQKGFTVTVYVNNTSMIAW